MRKRFILGAYWSARRESIEQCADRLILFFEGLTECDPAFAKWYQRGYSRAAALRTPVDTRDRSRLLALLDRGRSRRDTDRTVMENLGFGINLWNGGGDARDSVLSVNSGLYSDVLALLNSVVLDLPDDLSRLYEPDRMTRLLTVVARAWEPAWAGVISGDARDARDFDASVPFMDWMLYVPVGIPTVEPPSSVVPLAGLGSIVIAQPTPPVVGDSEAERRVRTLQNLIRARAPTIL